SGISPRNRSLPAARDPSPEIAGRLSSRMAAPITICLLPGGRRCPTGGGGIGCPPRAPRAWREPLTPDFPPNAENRSLSHKGRGEASSSLPQGDAHVAFHHYPADRHDPDPLGGQRRRLRHHP